MSTAFCLVLCSSPDEQTANALAEQLLAQQLAACINVLKSPMHSFYRWQGHITTSEEYLLLIKTSWQLYSSLETALKTAHPYQVPEIIALPIEQGLSAYLNWLSDNLADPKQDQNLA